MSDKTHTIRLENSVYLSLCQLRLPGESISDALGRLMPAIRASHIRQAKKLLAGLKEAK